MHISQSSPRLAINKDKAVTCTIHSANVHPHSIPQLSSPQMTLRFLDMFILTWVAGDWPACPHPRYQRMSKGSRMCIEVCNGSTFLGARCCQFACGVAGLRGRDQDSEEPHSLVDPTNTFRAYHSLRLHVQQSAGVIRQAPHASITVSVPTLKHITIMSPASGLEH